MTDAIRTESLGKTYPGAVEAVRGVNLTVRPCEIFGFLGPNGAGKTTMISMLTTLLRPTAGRAEVDGLDVVRYPEKVRRRIGLVFQRSTSDETLTGRENLEIAAGLHGISPAAARPRIREVLERLDLREAADRRVGGYSGWDAAETGDRRRDRPRAGDPLPRRTDARPRPAGPGGLLAGRPPPEEVARPHDLPDDPLPRGGGPVVRPDLDHRPRVDPQDREPRGAQAGARRGHRARPPHPAVDAAGGGAPRAPRRPLGRVGGDRGRLPGQGGAQRVARPRGRPGLRQRPDRHRRDLDAEAEPRRGVPGDDGT